MSRIEINAGGRHIIVDHDGGDLAYVVEKAEKLWQAVESPEKPPGPAYGFQAERRYTDAVPPLGRSAYDRGRPPGQVDA